MSLPMTGILLKLMSLVKKWPAAFDFSERKLPTENIYSIAVQLEK